MTRTANNAMENKMATYIDCFFTLIPAVLLRLSDRGSVWGTVVDSNRSPEGFGRLKRAFLLGLHRFFTSFLSFLNHCFV
ncbi:hypothetical protein B4113_1829 [Geobacillus sp. B4113_201601]|nr:hypothetical protein B4113_1829 [Geobacillus sp. B4113_201601]